MKHYISKTGAMLLATLMSAPAVMAQTEAQSTLSPKGYSPAALELLKEQRLWFKSSNAAGAVLDDTRNYSEVKIGYDQTSGNFHRPQEGKSVNNAGVDCEGFMNLGSALVWGEFSFKQRNVNEASFNASIADPFRGMPFFMADEHLSDWRNQNYDMKFRASTPLYWGKLALGVEGTYRAAIAAKQRDPRVDTRYFELGVNPALVYSIDGKHSIGADFQYTSLKEDSRMSNVNYLDDQTYYFLFGLGAATVEMGSGITTDYHGHIAGGGLQYNYNNGGSFNILAGVDYTRHVENVDRNPTIPQKAASVKDDTWKASIQATVNGARFAHRINLGGYTRDIKGIQYVSENNGDIENPGWSVLEYDVRSTYRTTRLSADYSLVRKRADEYAWRVDAGVAYNKQKDRYLLPEARKNSSGVYTHLTAKYNFNLGDKMNRRLLISATGGVMSAGKGEYVYSDALPALPTITVLETGNINYLSSDYWNVGGSATYSQQIKGDNRMNAYARAEINYVKTSDFDFNHRRYLSFAVGVTF